MTIEENVRRRSRRNPEKASLKTLRRVLSIALLLGLSGSSIASAASVEQDAKDILRSMSDYLGEVAAFSVDADIDNEVLDQQGRKLHLSSSASILIRRPGNFYAHRIRTEQMPAT